MSRAFFLLARAWFADRLKHWLVSCVFLVDTAIEVATFCFFDLGNTVNRCHDWLERQQYKDTGEGPFATYAEARQFARAEIAVPWRILFRRGGWRVYARRYQSK